MKKILLVSVLAICASIMTGCLPKTRSMGASLMPMPLSHRTTSVDSVSEVTLKAAGYVSSPGENNVKNGIAVGGNMDFTYRFGNPLFFNVAVNGFSGKVNFECSDNEDCTKNESKRYREWLDTEIGEADYGILNAQERILVGLDFNPGQYIFLGLASGLQFFQGHSEYDDMRRKLERRKVMDNVDGKHGWGIVYSLWLGSRFGENGRLGSVSFESAFLQPLKDGGSWDLAFNLSYTAANGIFVGASTGSIMEYTLFAGKRFDF